MTNIAATSMEVLRLLPRAALILGMLAAPVLAMPATRGATATTIAAPSLKKSGAGFVLLMSLRRG